MLQISAEQMDAMRAVSLQAFTEEMMWHLPGFSPELAQTLTEPQLRKAVNFGIERALGYGLSNRGPVRLYLESMLLFGSHFENDPQYPWAARALKDTAHPLQMDRAKRLYAEVMAYRQQVAGPDDDWTIAALRRLESFAAHPVALRPGHHVADLQVQLAQIYPEKAGYIGTEAMHMLIQSGAGLASHHGFSSVQEVALLIILMFSFGHGCTADPLYPWIATTLSDARLPTPAARAARLEKKARTWLAHVLLHFGPAAS